MTLPEITIFLMAGTLLMIAVQLAHLISRQKAMEKFLIDQGRIFRQVLQTLTDKR